MPETDRIEGLIEKLDVLQTAADEVKVKLHLGKAELRDLYGQASKKLDTVRGELKLLQQDAVEPSGDIARGLSDLLTEVGKTLGRIAERL